jgi:hypothetical protein
LLSLVEAQQGRIADLEQRIARLTVPLVEASATVPTATSLRTPLTVDQIADASSRRRSRTSRVSARRTFFKTAGAAAAALVATGVTLPELTHRAQAAPTADGNNVILGQTNTMTNPTVFNPVSGAGTLVLMNADNSSSTSTSQSTAGIQGKGPTITGGASGVVGIANGAQGYGIFGQSDAGYGVVGAASTGIDLYAGGTGRLQQFLQASVGAPTSGAHAAGEQIRDSNGDLYLCVSGGSPGAWIRAAGVKSGYTGGAVHLLTGPIRVFDTRVVPGHQLLSGSVTTFQVTGVVVNNVSVPAGALAVIGTFTVTNTQGGGYLIAYSAALSSPPSVTTISYFGASQNLSNGTTVALSASGQLSIYVGSNATDALFDAMGFVM